MTTLIHADVFFFVATIASGILAILAAIALIYIIVILARMNKLSKRAKYEGDFLLDEVRDLRLRLAVQKFKIVPFVRFIRRIIRHLI